MSQPILIAAFAGVSLDLRRLSRIEFYSSSTLIIVPYQSISCEIRSPSSQCVFGGSSLHLHACAHTCGRFKTEGAMRPRVVPNMHRWKHSHFSEAGKSRKFRPELKSRQSSSIPFNCAHETSKSQAVQLKRRCSCCFGTGQRSPTGRPTARPNTSSNSNRHAQI